MRQISGSYASTTIITNGDVLCGDYAAFEEAVEYEELEIFLKLWFSQHVFYALVNISIYQLINYFFAV